MIIQKFFKQRFIPLKQQSYPFCHSNQFTISRLTSSSSLFILGKGNNIHRLHFGNYNNIIIDKKYFSTTIDHHQEFSIIIMNNNQENNNSNNENEGNSTLDRVNNANNSNGIDKNNINENNNKQQNNNRKRKSNNNRWAWARKWKQKKKDQKNQILENGDDEDNNNDDDDNVEQKQQVGGEREEIIMKEPTKKKNNRKPNNITWSDNPKEVNEGSFACSTMQSLYNINIDLPVSSSVSDDGNVIVEKKEVNTTSSQNKDDVKLPKRKVALFIGFLGTKYQGMQMNKGQRTIQAEIELALYRAKLISSSNFGYPNKYSWSSSARTDKGVHSCAQVCSCKILAPTEDFEVIREMINKELPNDIAILDVRRVARSYVAKTARDKVRYQYMLPSFVLQDYEVTRKLLLSIAGAKRMDGDTNRLKDWNDISNDEIKLLRESLKTYRISQELLDKLDSTLGRFAGTHKFHNYTSRKDAQDDSSRRYIHSFNVLEKSIDQFGMEWISTGVVGQSFLLHQIRKMISMTIDITRGADKKVLTEKREDVDIMEESFSPKYMSINVAPAQGLFLEMSYFDQYNKRAVGKGEDLDWHSNPNSEATIRWKKFKEENVMKHIMAEEEEQNNFIKYLFVQELHLKHVKYEATDEKQHTLYKSNKSESRN